MSAKPRARDERSRHNRMTRQLGALPFVEIELSDFAAGKQRRAEKSAALFTKTPAQLKADLKADKELGSVLQRSKPLKVKYSPVKKVMLFEARKDAAQVERLNTEIAVLQGKADYYLGLLNETADDKKIVGKTRDVLVRQWRQLKSDISAKRAQLPKAYLRLADPERYDVAEYQRLAHNELARLKAGKIYYQRDRSKKILRLLEPHRIIDNFMALMAHRQGAYVGNVPATYLPQLIAAIDTQVLLGMLAKSFAKFGRSGDVQYLLRLMARNLPLGLLANLNVLQEFKMQLGQEILLNSQPGRMHRDRQTLKKLDKAWPEFMRQAAASALLTPANDVAAQSVANAPLAVQKPQRRFARPLPLKALTALPKPARAPEPIGVTGTKRVRHLLKKHSQQDGDKFKLAEVASAELVKLKVEYEVRRQKYLAELLGDEQRAPTEFELQLAAAAAAAKDPTAPKQPKPARARSPKLTPKQRRLKKRGKLGGVTPQPLKPF